MTQKKLNPSRPEEFRDWAMTHMGIHAHIVYDYITDEDGVGVPGPLNGVTVQWDHDDDGNADQAVHVLPGHTLYIEPTGIRVA